jgi:SPP1 gp7 family putative phage head morphogenesis protein
LIEDYKDGLLSGLYTTRNLPQVWYDAYHSAFIKEALLAQGIVGTPTSGQLATIEGYNKNLYQFSSAKLYQQQISLESIPLDIEAVEFNQLFNASINQNSVAWSTVEKQHIFQSSNANVIWNQQVESRETFPYLQYVTANDEVVRRTHAELHGVVEPIKSKFWDTYYPPNGYNCRCTTASIFDKDSAIVSPVKEGEAIPIEKEFAKNWGQTTDLFDKSHSYYDVRKGDKALKKNNFNLPPKEL